MDTKEKERPPASLFVFNMAAGLEPISMQYAGGHLRPLVQKLVATMWHEIVDTLEREARFVVVENTRFM